MRGHYLSGFAAGVLGAALLAAAGSGPAAARIQCKGNSRSPNMG
jgi:hypothetical protein